MRLLPRGLAERVAGNLWVGPGIAALGAVAAAEVLVRVDRRVVGDLDVGFAGDAQAARSLLSTVAGSTMTVLGVILTITLAVLTLTANAYSPRVLRTISRDRMVKAVLAVFVATFAFTLDALRAVREDQVPSVTVTVAVALAFLSLGFLIALFHHLASRIRIETVVSEVHREAAEVIDARPRAEASARRPALPPQVDRVRAEGVGRVQRVDDDGLARLARATGGTVVLAVAPGDFVMRGAELAAVHGGRPLEESERDAVRGAVTLGVHRTLEQDVAFGFRQLVDVALRALSPAVQDPTTAHEALERAFDLLGRLGDRDLGPQVVADEDGHPRVVRDLVDWPALVGTVCDQVRTAAESQGDTVTLALMVRGLGHVEQCVHDAERLRATRAHVVRLREAAGRAGTDAAAVRRVSRAVAGGGGADASGRASP